MSDGGVCTTAGRPFVVAHCAQTKRAVCFVPNCGMWTCPHCAEERAEEWRMVAWAGASRLMQSGEHLQFLTLTARGGKGRTREKSLHDMAAAWPKLLDRLKYARGKKAEYIVIPEQHKNGVLHYHAIITAELSEHAWHDKAHASGFGYQAKKRDMADAVQAPAYVAKYLGKQFAHVVWPKNFRRVRKSSNWGGIEKPGKVEGAKYDTYLSAGACWWGIYMLQDGGYEVEIRSSAEEGLHLR